MFTLQDNNITLTRGDSFALGLVLAGRAVPEGAQGLFTVKASARSGEALIEKRVPVTGGGAVVALSPGDTRDLPFRTYLWDFRVIGPDGTVSTPMAAAAFTVAEVIGDA